VKVDQKSGGFGQKRIGAKPN